MFEGTVIRGRAEGQGKYTYQDGRECIGYFKESVYEKVKYELMSRTQLFEGYWDGQAKLRSEDGTRFEGTCERGRFMGLRKYFNEEGRLEVENWVEDEISYQV